MFIGNLQFAEEFLVSARRCKRSVQHRQRPEEASKNDIYPQFKNDITDKFCACSLLHLEICDISTNSRSKSQWQTRFNLCPSHPSVKSNNISIKAEQTDLHYKKYRNELICFCREPSAFDVSEFAFSVSDLLFP